MVYLEDRTFPRAAHGDGSRSIEVNLFFVFFSIFFLFPTSFGVGAKFVVIFLFCLAGVGVLLRAKRLCFTKAALIYFFVFLSSLFGVVVAALHGLVVNGSAAVHWPSLFRIVYIFVLVLFFSLAFYSERDSVQSSCCKMLLFFLAVQLFFVLLQAFGMASWLSVIYVQDKMRGMDSYMRGTGSFGNPNTLAIISIFSMVIVWFCSGSKKAQLFVVTLVGGIVLLSGSRTGAFVYAVALGVCALLGGGGASWKVVSSVIVIMLLAFAWSFGELAEEYFPYLWQVVKVANEVELVLEINSISSRFSNWSGKLEFFDSIAAPTKVLFGVGFVESYKVLDSEYLFLYLRTGILGTVTFALFAIFPFLYAKMTGKGSGDSTLFLLVLLLGLFWSLLFEFFSDFIMSILFFVVVSFFSSETLVARRG